MNFSVQNISYSMPIKRNGNNNPRRNIAFSGNHKGQTESHKIRKAATWLLGASMLFGATKTCINSADTRYSGMENYDGITVEFSNVDRETRDSVMKPVYDMRKNLTHENDFLKGVKFDITDNFANLEENEPFKEFLKLHKNDDSLSGISFYSDSRLKKQIALQEIGNINPAAIHNYGLMRHTLMHEVGHQFDNYFGHDHGADFALKWDSLLASKDTPYDFETVTQHDQDIDIEYNYNNSLSDSPKFQEALLADLMHISRMHRRHESLPHNLDYYIGNFNMYKQITPEDVDKENSARAEVYAQLFAYALGEDDGRKEKFLPCFKNCYEIVKGDVEKYLNIKNRE